MNNHSDMPVLILGAGISGLGCAAWLSKAGVDAVVLDTASKPGGVMRSEKHEGFLIEAGPNTLLDNSPSVGELIDLAGLRDETIEANPVSKKRFIAKDGEPIPIPMNPIAFIRTPLLSGMAKLRLFREPFVSPWQEEGDESLASFFSRRLGQEVLDYLVNPFVAGVYAGDPKQLSISATFPKLKAFEKNHGSLIKGALRGRPRSEGAKEKRPRLRSISFRDGLGQLPASLCDKLSPAAVKLGVSDTRVEYEAATKSWHCSYQHDGTQHEIKAARVVVTIPAHRLDLFKTTELRQAVEPLMAIPYAPVSVVTTGLRRDDVAHPLDGFGYLVPEKEQRNVLGTLWSSTLFPGRAPLGFVLLTTFIGGSRQPELAGLPENELRRLTNQEIKEMLGVKGSPVFQHVRRWERAIPQYNLGHLKYQRMMDELEQRFPGLHFATNYRDGVAVGDCIARAKRIAGEIASRAGKAQPASASSVQEPAPAMS